MTNSPQLRPLGELIGAEALGVDLSRPLDDATFAWVRRTFADHPVLVFRDQNLGAGELAAFGRRFGSPRMHALVKYRHAEHPEVSWLTNVEGDGKVDWYGVKRATDWHTDSTYEPHLPILAILHAKEIPSAKGGTVFADMRSAYDALRWPAVLQHPVSGRPILFVNPMHTHGFVGLPREEAWPLIEDLANHATQDRFVYYHHWRVGDVLMWDERATMHRGAGDYNPDEHRVMLRTIVYAN